MFILNEDVDNMADMARDAVRKIEENRPSKKTVLETVIENLQAVDIGRELYEEFELDSYEKKMSIDMMYYDHLLKNLDESYIPNVENAISSLYKTVKDIYEFVNLKPELYGNKITFSLIEESIDSSKSKINDVVYEYLDRHFYSLTPKQREEKYCDSCKEFTRQLVQENIANIDEAIEYSVKTKIMEGLLDRIALPFSIKSRIKYLMESEDYGKVFDQATLIQLVGLYDTKINAVAKVIASVV